MHTDTATLKALTSIYPKTGCSALNFIVNRYTGLRLAAREPITVGIKISLNNARKQYKKVKQGKLQNSEGKKYKKILESCIRRLKHRHYTNLIRVAGADSRKLWSVMNEVIDKTYVPLLTSQIKEKPSAATKTSQTPSTITLRQ